MIFLKYCLKCWEQGNSLIKLKQVHTCLNTRAQIYCNDISDFLIWLSFLKCIEIFKLKKRQSHITPILHTSMNFIKKYPEKATLHFKIWGRRPTSILPGRRYLKNYSISEKDYLLLNYKISKHKRPEIQVNYNSCKFWSSKHKTVQRENNSQ